MAETLLYYLIAINIVTLIVYGIDKVKAMKGKWRISEATLLLLAIIGGSVGANEIADPVKPKLEIE